MTTQTAKISGYILLFENDIAPAKNYHIAMASMGDGGSSYIISNVLFVSGKIFFLANAAIKNLTITGDYLIE